ncbi:hypothetical protein IP91_00597 [Pseudoduganella lurida]|uniref:Uncharacterized protein n=1 Tax=Pseudoduganella lurida TaxID=1036180 RepID=A0A562RKF1_9BURK|nr:hypothetical protein [Pseudoduganella lurida]TWI69528.1 hypothetical protein IP91_00597 [Pseudoduganella lurida]
MNKSHTCGSAPPYTLGLETVGIDDVLQACDLVGQLLQAVSPDANPRAAARLLAEASSAEHHNNPLARTILVQVARALQRRDLQ